jgi:hypothetical protein
VPFAAALGKNIGTEAIANLKMGFCAVLNEFALKDYEKYIFFPDLFVEPTVVSTLSPFTQMSILSFS